MMELKLIIRRKKEMIEAVEEILSSLHAGERVGCALLIERLKGNALFLDCEVQQKVLMFSGAVQFQVLYEPLVSREVNRCTDLLFEALGLGLK